MKKLLVLLALLTLACLLIACGESVDTTSSEVTSADTTSADTESDDLPSGNAFTDKSGEEILSILLADVSDITLVTESISPKNESTFRFHFFTYAPDSVISATISQPMIGTIPFFAGVLKTNLASEAQRLAEEILDNVNYRKLICADYKKAHTRAVGTTVVVILDGDTARADRLIEYFDSLAQA